MDDRQPKCPITENEVITLLAEDGTKRRYAKWCDVVHFFPQPEYSHVKYWDDEGKVMQYHFLPEDVLAELVEHGIPLVPRTDITQIEHNAWTEYVCALEASEAAIDADLDLILGDS